MLFVFVPMDLKTMSKASAVPVLIRVTRTTVPLLLTPFVQQFRTVLFVNVTLTLIITSIMVAFTNPRFGMTILSLPRTRNVLPNFHVPLLLVMRYKTNFVSQKM